MMVLLVQGDGIMYGWHFKCVALHDIVERDKISGVSEENVFCCNFEAEMIDHIYRV